MQHKFAKVVAGVSAGASADAGASDGAGARVGAGPTAISVNSVGRGRNHFGSSFGSNKFWVPARDGSLEVAVRHERE